MGMTNWAYKYKEYLEGLKNNNVIGGYKVNFVKTLWQTWTLWQKLTWFWNIKLGFGRDEFTRYRVDREWYLYRKRFDFLVGDHGISRLWDQSEKWEKEYDAKHKKFWYEYSPNLTVLVDLSIKLVRPIEYIEISFPMPLGANEKTIKKDFEEIVDEIEKESGE